jgi:hypothetical protein
MPRLPRRASQPGAWQCCDVAGCLVVLRVTAAIGEPWGLLLEFASKSRHATPGAERDRNANELSAPFGIDPIVFDRSFDCS